MAHLMAIFPGKDAREIQKVFLENRTIEGTVSVLLDNQQDSGNKHDTM